MFSGNYMDGMTVHLCREYDQPGCCRSIAGDMAAKRADTLAMTSEAFLFLPCALVTTAIAVGFEPLSWSSPAPGPGALVDLRGPLRLDHRVQLRAARGGGLLAQHHGAG